MCLRTSTAHAVFVVTVRACVQKRALAFHLTFSRVALERDLIWLSIRLRATVHSVTLEITASITALEVPCSTVCTARTCVSRCTNAFAIAQLAIIAPPILATLHTACLARLTIVAYCTLLARKCSRAVEIDLQMIDKLRAAGRLASTVAIVTRQAVRPSFTALGAFSTGTLEVAMPSLIRTDC
jgi:hypothetical protein